MRLKPLGHNQNELTLNNDTMILFSFETPVAAWTESSGFMRTTVHYSHDTTSHINAWLRYHQAQWVNPVPQDLLNSLLD